MRIFNRILKMLFVLIFIVSVCFNVVLGLSSDYSLVFKDSGVKRRQLAYRAAFYVKGTAKYTFEDYDSENKTRAIVSCVKDNEKTDDNLTCEQITYVYNDSKEVVKTVYFPNDGYKYVSEGDSKTKVAVNSSVVTNYAFSLYMGSLYYLHYLSYDTETPNQTVVSDFKTKLNFNFNKFSLTRNVTFKIKQSETASLDVNLVFDNNDKLLSLKSENNELSIKYDTTKLNFPSFSSFVEA